MLSPIISKQTGVSAAGDSRATPLRLQQMSELAIHLVVTRADGTGPQLTVWVQDSADGVNFADAFQLPAITATGAYRASWKDLGHSVGQWVALRWTVAGTSPVFDFTAYATGPAL